MKQIPLPFSSVEALYLNPPDYRKFKSKSLAFLNFYLYYSLCSIFIAFFATPHGHKNALLISPLSLYHCLTVHSFIKVNEQPP